VAHSTCPLALQNPADNLRDDGAGAALEESPIAIGGTAPDCSFEVERSHQLPGHRVGQIHLGIDQPQLRADEYRIAWRFETIAPGGDPEGTLAPDNKDE
jgi:hypothetical protein